MTHRAGRPSDKLFVSLLVVACSVLVLCPSGFEGARQQGALRAKAIVLAVDDTGVRSARLIKTGTQVLQVELLSGPLKGQKIAVRNELRGAMELDEIFRTGHEVLVEYALRPDGSVEASYARGRYRLGATLFLVFLFVALLLAVAGLTGLKALLSFAFAVLMLWKVFYPAVLKGHDPVLFALVVTAALTGAVCFLVGGVNRRGAVAFAGSSLGVCLTCGLSILFTRRFGIHGAVQPFATGLLYSGFLEVDLTRLFMAGIVIAASGALMDVAMDIAAAMQEVWVQNPDIGLWDHVASGMSVGRAVIGTMSTTLLLAYSGSSSALWMVFMGQGVPLENILNSSLVAGEVLHTLVGSFGLVTVAPFTALAGGIAYRWRANRG